MLIALLIAAFCIQLASHYLPWARFFDANRLPRPVAYIIGVVGILIPVSVWLACRATWSSYSTIERAADWFTLAALWGFCAAAGLGVLSGYGLDMVLNWRDQAREARQRENLLLDQRLTDINNDPDE